MNGHRDVLKVLAQVSLEGNPVMLKFAEYISLDNSEVIWYLKESHERAMATLNSFERWEGRYDITGGLSILVHSAYHLGGIRQALGAIRAGN